MTTIAWDGETLAADSQATESDCADLAACRKIFRIKNTLVGCAGDVEDWMQFLEWLRSGEIADERPKGLKDMSAIVIRPSGKAYEYGTACIPMNASKIYAVGTGKSLALGAMLAGASAVEAVRIARRIDVYTGGPVRSLRLDKVSR